MPKPYTPNDAWSKKAASEGYRARSVYKLMELDDTFTLFKPGITVLDFGAAPGSWMQYVSKQIGSKGLVIGFDLTDIKPIADNAHVYRQDIMDLPAVDMILEKEHIAAADVVLSDIAPSTSGVKDIDQWKSIELSQAVVTAAERYLKPKGKCVLKVFRGADFDPFIATLKRTWNDVKIVTVEASRDRSREVYVVMSKR